MILFGHLIKTPGTTKVFIFDVTISSTSKVLLLSKGNRGKRKALPKTMLVKFLCVTILICLQVNYSLSQRQWVPPTTTAAEMRNPYTWYWPYAIAASEAYREYFINAQQITNQLYTQAAITGAFTPGGGNQLPNGRYTSGRYAPARYMG